jgi:cytoskeletal protein RodZ
MTATQSTQPRQAGEAPANAGDVATARPSQSELFERPVDSLGAQLRQRRLARNMSITELSRVTRIPTASLEAIEADRFDELPGEVFVRGFLRAYAQAVGALPDDVLARYTSSRRVAHVTPLPIQTPLQAAREGQGRRFGVAIAFVLLLILLSLALSIVLKPRGRDMPAELSERQSGGARVTLTA